MNNKDFLTQILNELRQIRGLDLSGYRRKIQEKHFFERFEKHQVDNRSAYLEKLRFNPAECDRLIDMLLINVSSFFRNPVVFETIAQSILPQLIEKKRASGINEIRVWSAGCASGEESYSLAILLKEAFDKNDFEITPYIFATDISKQVLSLAEQAEYQRDSLENIKLGLFDKYFSKQDELFRLNPTIQKMVHFSLDDLTSSSRIAPADSIFGMFDLVVCRNVLIYFDLELQRRVFEKLIRALRMGGYLILGSCESLPSAMKNKAIQFDGGNGIFQKTG